MSDENDPTEWEKVPQAMRRLVYEQIRVLASTTMRDAAAALAAASRVGPEPAAALAQLAETHRATHEAYMTAVEVLLSNDSEICLDCMDYHGERVEHPVDKKALS